MSVVSHWHCKWLGESIKQGCKSTKSTYITVNKYGVSQVIGGMLEQMLEHRTATSSCVSDSLQTPVWPVLLIVDNHLLNISKAAVPLQMFEDNGRSQLYLPSWYFLTVFVTILLSCLTSPNLRVGPFLRQVLRPSQMSTKWVLWRSKNLT